MTTAPTDATPHPVTVDADLRRMFQHLAAALGSELAIADAANVLLMAGMTSLAEIDPTDAERAIEGHREIAAVIGRKRGALVQVQVPGAVASKLAGLERAQPEASAREIVELAMVLAVAVGRPSAATITEALEEMGHEFDREATLRAAAGFAFPRPEPDDGSASVA